MFDLYIIYLDIILIYINSIFHRQYILVVTYSVKTRTNQNIT